MGKQGDRRKCLDRPERPLGPGTESPKDLRNIHIEADIVQAPEDMNGLEEVPIHAKGQQPSGGASPFHHS